MSVNGKNTRELVDEAADQLQRAGIRPTVMKVRQIIGQGSATTIANQLQEWHKRNQVSDRTGEEPLPSFLVEANRALLEQAESAAIAKFAGERAGYCEEILALRNNVESSEVVRLELLAELAMVRGDLADKKSLLENMKDELVYVQAENQTKKDEIEADRLEIAALRGSLDAKTTEYAEDLHAAETRLRDMEKRMLMEIDKARQDSKDSIAYAHRKAAEFELDLARIRAASKGEVASLTQTIIELNRENGGLTREINTLQKTLDKKVAKRVGFRPCKPSKLATRYRK